MTKDKKIWTCSVQTQFSSQTLDPQLNPSTEPCIQGVDYTLTVEFHSIILPDSSDKPSLSLCHHTLYSRPKELLGSHVTISTFHPSYSHSYPPPRFQDALESPPYTFSLFYLLTCHGTFLFLFVYTVNLKHILLLLTKISNILNQISDRLQKISPSFTYTP